jgi:hypothetical protein
MEQETPPVNIAAMRVVYELPGMDAVAIRSDVPYRATDGGTLTMDVYYPPGATKGARLPAVVFVAGYPDPGMQALLGCRFKEMGAYVSWAQLAAVSGIVAITYTNLEPEADLHALLRHVREDAASLNVDETRIGLWACSGNAPLALSALIGEAREYAACAVLCYGFLLDLDGSTAVAEASRTYRFANPCAGKSVDDLPPSLPLFIARAGQDQFPHLNETLDGFLERAVENNLPVTFVNHPTGPHAFDLLDDSETSRAVVAQVLAFMRHHLGCNATGKRT